MANFLAAPNLQLPWSSTIDDDGRYWKIFGFLLVPFLIFCIAIPLINVPQAKREELEKLPPQLAKVVLEKKELPVPTPKPSPPPKEEEKKEEKKEEPKPDPKPTPKPKPEPKPQPEPKQVKLVEKAREKAQAEISQFADSLSEMRDTMSDLSEINAELTQGTGAAAELSRDVITSGATRGSGGIKTENLSRDTGGVAVSGKKTTAAVTSKLKTGDGAAKAKVASASEERSTRSREDIRKVMDQNKGAIYAIYNRALRKNPALEGKVVFKLEIDQNGKVVSAVVVSSELNDADLERKLIARISLINFGAKQVLKTTLNYDMDFLPY